MNSRLMVPVLVALFAAPSLPASEFYRWRDENGVMQYTQTPPPAGVRHRRESLRGTAPPAEADSDESKEDISSRISSVTVREDVATRREVPETAAEKKARLARCEKARQQLALYESTPAVKIVGTGDDGEPYRLTPEMREARMAQFRKRIADDCR